MNNFKSQTNFISRASLLRQFTRWGFPSRQARFQVSDELLARIKELWARNLTQLEMVQILKEEDGIDIKPSVLARVRKAHGFSLHGISIDESFVDDGDQDDDASSEEEVFSAEEPEVADDPRKVADLEARKQRRLATVFQPPTDGSPARFPSEMTSEEARTVLGLDKPTYQLMRNNFMDICNQRGITRKTVAGPAAWEAAKTELIGSMPELRSAFWIGDNQLEAKKLSVDVICMAVTKCMRNTTKHVHAAKRKNALGADPAQALELRRTFRAVLFETGEVEGRGRMQNWNQLKVKWAKKSSFIKDILDNENRDAESKAKAVEAERLARDFLRRLRVELKEIKKKELRNEQSAREAAEESPVPGESEPSFDDGYVHATFDLAPEISDHAVEPTPPPRARSQTMRPSRTKTRKQTKDVEKDNFRFKHVFPGNQTSPQSNRTARYSHTPTPAMHQPQQHSQQQSAHQQPLSQHSQQHINQQPLPQATAVFLRLHPTSNFTIPNNIWISTVSTLSLDYVRAAAVVKFPGTTCGLVEGVVKDGSGGELPLRVQDDQELAAYVSHLQGASPTFNVQLLQL